MQKVNEIFIILLQQWEILLTFDFSCVENTVGMRGNDSAFFLRFHSSVVGLRTTGEHVILPFVRDDEIPNQI